VPGVVSRAGGLPAVGPAAPLALNDVSIGGPPGGRRLCRPSHL